VEHFENDDNNDNDSDDVEDVSVHEIVDNASLSWAPNAILMIAASQRFICKGDHGRYIVASYESLSDFVELKSMLWLSSD
jgi:hypothetical protein